MSEFLSMGGYAAFVWPAYAVTFLAVFVNIWSARRALRRARARAHAQRRLGVAGEPS
jgi:heme exporter protein CcmD